MIYWDGKSSDELRVIVEHYPERIIPKRQYTTVSVPGRNGELYFDGGAFESYQQPYDIYISAERQKLPIMARKAAAWLSVPGYRILEDSYEYGVFRKAFFAGPANVENIMNRFGRATINFHCKPQRFLKAGDFAKTYTEGVELINPTEFEALPLIVVQGIGAGTLTVNGVSVQLSDVNGVTLDSETQNAYASGQNANNTMTGKFPALGAGSNEISFSGGITSVQIKPRWWTL